MRSRAFLLRQRFVQGALAITFEVQRDISEGHALESLRNRGPCFSGERAVHLFGRDFDARQLVMQPHAELPKAEIAQRRFATFNQRKTLGSDLGAVGHTRGKRRGSGAIPSGQASALREWANFRIEQTAIEQWGQHAILLAGAMTAAEIDRTVRAD